MEVAVAAEVEVGQANRGQAEAVQAQRQVSVRAQQRHHSMLVVRLYFPRWISWHYKSYACRPTAAYALDMYVVTATSEHVSECTAPSSDAFASLVSFFTSRVVPRLDRPRVSTHPPQKIRIRSLGLIATLFLHRRNSSDSP